ncbi:hypothetical protein FDP25_02215 [Roseovarius sp. A21]|uniref:Uncharacterized protein n=1 Tax=Roseovarius bejariae TaxID=2576383 RepID=A0A844CL84_9RHOB|nr:hypothetical protein [Roseovarius bejariae]MRU14235.1 hypothetical protein [Roseovarius bejariae]
MIVAIFRLCQTSKVDLKLTELRYNTLGAAIFILLEPVEQLLIRCTSQLRVMFQRLSLCQDTKQNIIFCNRALLHWLTAPPPISSKEIGPKSFQDFGTPLNHSL